jgi:Histidine kinase-, DNA gyrase B-, and HSP90-like ATPase
MHMSSSKYFKTNSAIKSIVGRDLITDKFVAIYELVKNAYDANATEVHIQFNTKASPPNITIRDNGKGMSERDIDEKWLHLAYSDKTEGAKNDREHNRVFVGSKGVGRFSCDNLGAQLHISTKIARETFQHELKVDWSLFENVKEKLFEQVGVQYSQLKPSSFEESHFTKIVITQLRHEWSTAEIEKAKNSLIRLKNPFVDSDGFTIFCYADKSKPNVEDRVISNLAEVLRTKAISLELEYGKQADMRLTDRGQPIYHICKSDVTPINNTHIKIAITYLTQSAKATFARRMKIEAVKYGNVFIYKNGFRVYPYGETDEDIFGLNLRKGQGYARNIGTREIMGYIEITDPDNFFKESSSRNNGFIQNAQFEQLENIYMEFVHKPLERYIQLIKWGEVRGEGEVFLNDADDSELAKFTASLKKGGFKIESLAKDLDFSANNPETALARIAPQLPASQQKTIGKAINAIEYLKNETYQKDKAILAKEKRIDEVTRQNKNLLIARDSENYGQQVSHHFTVMASRTDKAVKQFKSILASLHDLTEKQKSNFIDSIRIVQYLQDELRILRNVLTKTNYDTKASQELNLYEVAKQHFTQNIQSYDSLKVTCVQHQNVSADVWMANIKIIDYLMALDNFYMNAKEHEAKYLNIEFESDRILFQSDSKPIAKENLERIFELGFSTKRNGTGIGMDQIKYFFNKAGFNIQALHDTKQVCFEVTKRKR